MPCRPDLQRKRIVRQELCGPYKGAVATLCHPLLERQGEHGHARVEPVDERGVERWDQGVVCRYHQARSCIKPHFLCGQERSNLGLLNNRKSSVGCIGDSFGWERRQAQFPVT